LNTVVLFYHDCDIYAITLEISRRLKILQILELELKKKKKLRLLSRSFLTLSREKNVSNISSFVFVFHNLTTLIALMPLIYILHFFIIKEYCFQKIIYHAFQNKFL